MKKTNKKSQNTCLTKVNTDWQSFDKDFEEKNKTKQTKNSYFLSFQLWMGVLLLVFLFFGCFFYKSSGDVLIGKLPAA